MSTVHRHRIVADRYRLVEQLGQGGMGRVWRAHDDLLHRDVAIKEIVPPAGLTAAEREEMRDRTLREARAIARLSHPNVVRIFDVLSTDGDPWIVMEYVRGRSLQEVLATDGPLPVARVVDIGFGVLAALRAAHRAGVLHRDVKPGNVLLADDGRVVLTDFGLATVPGDPVVTRTGLVLGSPAYLAPERAADGSAGPEADMWSLGATLFAAVEGQSPYARPSAMATLAALATEPPAATKQAGPLRPLLTGLLRKKPSERISPVEAERLLMRAAGRRPRAEPGRPPYSGVRLRRPPGPATFAAADAALAAGAGKRPAAAGSAAPAGPTAGSARIEDAAPGGPAGAGRAEEPVPGGAADAGRAEESVPGGAADAGPAERQPEAVRASHDQAVAVERPDLQPTCAGTPDAQAAQTPDVKAAPHRSTDLADPKAPAAGRGVLDLPVPSSMDAEPEPVVPIVLGPSAPPDAVVGMATVSPPPTRQHSRQRLWWWVAAGAGAAIALALVLTVAAVASHGSDGERGEAGGVPSTDTHGAGAEARASVAPTQTAGSPSPTANGGDPVLPRGWRYYRDQTGFRVAVPAGWRMSRDGSIVYFREPGGGRVLGIDQTDRPKRDPVKDWQRQESARVAAGDWTDYRRVRIVAVRYFRKAADWEFTYRTSGGRTHVINRGFITSPHQAYAIYWSTPQSQWSANLDNFRLIARSFQPRR